MDQDSTNFLKTVSLCHVCLCKYLLPFFAIASTEASLCPMSGWVCQWKPFWILVEDSFKKGYIEEWVFISNVPSEGPSSAEVNTSPLLPGPRSILLRCHRRFRSQLPRRTPCCSTAWHTMRRGWRATPSFSSDGIWASRGGPRPPTVSCLSTRRMHNRRRWQLSYPLTSDSTAGKTVMAFYKRLCCSVSRNGGGL